MRQVRFPQHPPGLGQVRDALRSLYIVANIAAGPPPSKSGFGGLRRLGTVLGRQNKGPKGVDRPPSPDKRSRPLRNPLRRGPSSRHDMETIPSPPATSSSDLPALPPRREATSPQAARSQSNERPPSNQDQRRRNDQLNGDTILPAPTRVSSLPMTNGVSTSRDLTSPQESQVAPPAGPPPGKVAEVSTGVLIYNDVLLTIVDTARF